MIFFSEKNQFFFFLLQIFFNSSFLSTPKQHVDLDKFEKKEFIGKGNFGKVFKDEEKETGKIYAAKISLTIINAYSKDEMLNLSREININAGLNHQLLYDLLGSVRLILIIKRNQ